MISAGDICCGIVGTEYSQPDSSPSHVLFHRTTFFKIGISSSQNGPLLILSRSNTREQGKKPRWHSINSKTPDPKSFLDITMKKTNRIWCSLLRYLSTSRDMRSPLRPVNDIHAWCWELYLHVIWWLRWQRATPHNRLLRMYRRVLCLWSESVMLAVRQRGDGKTWREFVDCQIRQRYRTDDRLPAGTLLDHLLEVHLAANDADYRHI